MEFNCSDINVWKEALSSYSSRILSLDKPNLPSLDEFYRTELPSRLHARLPEPYLTKSELHSLMQWKLTRGKYRPRLLGFVSSLDEESVKSASKKAFLALPDVSKAVSELTVLKGVGPATASAVLAAFDPAVAPFMSDEKLSSEDEPFTASDVERALWSSAVGAKLDRLSQKPNSRANPKISCKRKRC
uniref:Uncharacterized protein n=1 Tax=Opuntia streptacantha TaxID=393608 RepID=A0A7C8YF87_OPUST